jgi:hypothetical protein
MNTKELNQNATTMEKRRAIRGFFAERVDPIGKLALCKQVGAHFRAHH